MFLMLYPWKELGIKKSLMPINEEKILYWLCMSQSDVFRKEIVIVEV
jgi:DNA replication protein DnaD